MEFTQKRRLTVRIVCGELRYIPVDAGTVWLMTLHGRADGYRHTESAKPGDINKVLVGEFEALDVATGERYTSPACYMLEPHHAEITARLEQGERVEFGYLIGYKHSNTVTGYEYVVEVVKKPSPVDPMFDIRAQLDKAIKKLKVVKK